MSLVEDVSAPISPSPEVVLEAPPPESDVAPDVGPNRVPFDQFYEDAIAPTLDALDSRHRRAMAVLIGGLVAAAFAVTLEALQLPTNQNLLAIIAVTIGVGIAPGAAMLSPLPGLAKIGLLDALAEAYGVDYDAAGDLPDSYGACVAFGLLPSAAKCDFNDVISGTRGTVEFTVCRAVIRAREGGGGFHGQFFRLTTPFRVGSPTVLLREAPGLDDFLCPPGMQRVGLEDTQFDETFRAFGVDQVEARALLTPPFMQRLNALEEAFKGQNLRCAFTKAEILVRLETADAFMPKALFRLDKRRAAVEGVARRFDQVFKLIDSFHNG